MPPPLAAAPRVRFAPSPTGSLHIGNVRTALFNWLFARHDGGTFVLRLEDTDRERSTQESEDAVLHALRFMGLEWDEGPDRGGPHTPYRQSERGDLYEAEGARLLAGGHAYRCYCTPTELEARRDPRRPGYDRRCRDLEAAQRTALEAEGRTWVLRFRAPTEGETTYTDLVYGPKTFSNHVSEDWVMVRSNGTPTYNFVVVVDDADMLITHVIRGDDHIPNTPKQVQLFAALGHTPPLFAHLPLITQPGGKPLSKRFGDVSLAAFEERGYLPAALVNFLALLGWAPPDERVIMSRAELVTAFDLDRVGRSSALWDPAKLDWFNGQYLRRLSAQEVAELVWPHMVGAGLVAEADVRARVRLAELVPLIHERLATLSQAPELLRFFYADPGPPVAPEHLLLFADVLAVSGVSRARAVLQEVDPWDAPALEAALRAIPEALGLKPKQVFQPIRVATTGTTVSPPLFETLAALGREETLGRLDRTLEKVRR